MPKQQESKNQMFKFLIKSKSVRFWYTLCSEMHTFVQFNIFDFTIFIS